MIDRGEPALGVTEYDGGLFDPEQHPWLEGRSVPDALLAPALDGALPRRWRARRLPRPLRSHARHGLRAAARVGARRGRRRAPARRVAAPPRARLLLHARADRRRDRRADARPDLSPALGGGRQQGLSGEEALDALLRLRVLDPAMGSGHFLVGAAEFLAQAIATDPSYDGDLSLADLRRLVAERCLYGVDLNPLAVELARLSLWLVTAREGEPLTFLGNLRVGDSLVGADTETLLDRETGLRGPHRGTCGRAAAGDRRAPAAGRRTRAPTPARRSASPIGSRGFVCRSRCSPSRRSSASSLPRIGPGSTGRSSSPRCSSTSAASPCEGGGFDAVIGNPPYIRVQEIGRDARRLLPRALRGRPRQLRRLRRLPRTRAQPLSPHGRLGFIVPNKLFKLDYGERLRSRCLRGRSSSRRSSTSARASSSPGRRTTRASSCSTGRVAGALLPPHPGNARRGAGRARRVQSSSLAAVSRRVRSEPSRGCSCRRRKRR